MAFIKRLFILLLIIVYSGCNDESIDPLLTKCSINNLSVLPGECNTDGAYELTIDFTTNAPTDSFELLDRNDEPLGIFNISDLPIRISNFEPSGLEEDFIKVCISDDLDCCSEIGFAPQECP